MATLFQNARQVAHYASYRPSYPDALFKCISAHTVSNHTVADVGCGTGQATASLLRYFDQVIGVDTSESQIKAARQEHPSLKFIVGQESKLPFAEKSLSCVAVAQAAHWFDLPAFYREVDRVLESKGVLAIWCYGLPQFPSNAELQRMIIRDLYEDTLGSYWDERRRLVEHMYKDLATIDNYHDNYKTKSIEEKGFSIEREVSSHEIGGYIRSWSGYTRYCEHHEVSEGSEDDPLRPVEALLENQNNPIKMVAPVRLL